MLLARFARVRVRIIRRRPLQHTDPIIRSGHSSSSTDKHVCARVLATCGRSCSPPQVQSRRQRAGLPTCQVQALDLSTILSIDPPRAKPTRVGCSGPFRTHLLRGGGGRAGRRAAFDRNETAASADVMGRPTGVLGKKTGTWHGISIHRAVDRSKARSTAPNHNVPEPRHVWVATGLDIGRLDRSSVSFVLDAAGRRRVVKEHGAGPVALALDRRARMWLIRAPRPQPNRSDRACACAAPWDTRYA